MKRFVICGSFLSLVALLSAGCAATDSGATRNSAVPNPQSAIRSPQSSAVVLSYEPETAAEVVVAEALELTDAVARAAIEKTDDDLEKAIGAFVMARSRLNVQELPPGVTRPTMEEVKRQYDAALLLQKRHEGLIREQSDRYERFFLAYPANWYARHRFADFLTDNHLNFEAAAQWRKVIEMAPAFPFAYNSLGTLYNHIGRDLEAVLLFRKAIELKGDEPTFCANLAVNYSTHRNEVSGEFGWDLPRVFRECINTYQRARALAPKDHEIAYDLASQYVLAKYFHVENTADEAIEAWKYYLALDLVPFQRGVAFRNMATIYLRQKKDSATARAWLDKAMALMPDDPSCKAILEQCAAAEKQPAETK